MLGTGKHGWIGVDLGASAIKVAQIMRHRSRYELVDAAIIRRDSASIASHVSNDPSDAILGGLSLAERIRGRRAAAVLSMRDCEFHALQVKQSHPSPEELQRELASAMPMNWRERSYDAWQIDHPSDARNHTMANIGVISTSTMHADQAAADLVKAKLECRSLDAAPTALARAMQIMVGRKDTPLAAIDWGYAQSTFCAIREGRPLYVRRLKQCEFSQVPKQLAEAASCSHEEAIALLQRHGVSASSDGEGSLGNVIRETVHRQLERMRCELQRTLDYLRSHRNNLLPAGMVLFGAGATIKGSSAWLSNAVGVEVRPWQPDSKILAMPGNSTVPIVLLAPAVAASALAWGAKTWERK